MLKFLVLPLLWYVYVCLVPREPRLYIVVSAVLSVGREPPPSACWLMQLKMLACFAAQVGFNLFSMKVSRFSPAMPLPIRRHPYVLGYLGLFLLR